MTSSFNSLSDTTLEFQRSTSDTTRKNLTLFVQAVSYTHLTLPTKLEV